MATFTPLLDILADVPDPRRAEGKLYKLPFVLLPGFAVMRQMRLLATSVSN
ncbi:hypothetical protein [Acidiphilium sp.]|uniref:hypothetical protein n=1 Tax=Acidiphilium sp. TaxID=527 RepID=UPI003D0450ED